MQITIIDEKELVNVNDKMTIEDITTLHVRRFETTVWPCDRLIVAFGNDFKIIKDNQATELIGTILSAIEVMAYI